MRNSRFLTCRPTLVAPNKSLQVGNGLQLFRLFKATLVLFLIIDFNDFISQHAGSQPALLGRLFKTIVPKKIRALPAWEGYKIIGLEFPGHFGPVIGRSGWLQWDRALFRRGWLCDALADSALLPLGASGEDDVAVEDGIERL